MEVQTQTASGLPLPPRTVFRTNLGAQMLNNPITYAVTSRTAISAKPLFHDIPSNRARRGPKLRARIVCFSVVCRHQVGHDGARAGIAGLEQIEQLHG